MRGIQELCKEAAQVDVGLDNLRSLSNLYDADSKPWCSGFVCARCAQTRMCTDVSKAAWLSLAPQCYGNHSLTSPKSFFFFFSCYFQFTEETETAIKLSSSRNAALQPVLVSPVYEAVYVFTV